MPVNYNYIHSNGQEHHIYVLLCKERSLVLLM
uniref:Uncharacterized protein n=1 Tax=Anguilla anguilla TaxID=7936 RepID=A0A0E9STA5_ANGAN